MSAPTAEELRTMLKRHEEIRRIACQSWLIHPDWDEDDHVAFLEQEGFDLSEQICARSSFGYSPDSAERYVRMWARNPSRCFEGIR